MCAQPWWVNLLLLVPALSYLLWRRQGLLLSWRKLFVLALFAISFGFVEAAVVVYLRAAVGVVGHYSSTISPLQYSSTTHQQAVAALGQFPQRLRTIEVVREAATMIMLGTVALLASTAVKERCASFLWAFAAWDLTYYAGLWATLRWPSSFKDYDVLFLIPVPWVAPVWFPVLVSSLTLLAVALSRTARAAYARAHELQSLPENR